MFELTAPMVQARIASVFRAVLLMIVAASVIGCAGTVIVEFSVDASVSGRDEAGKTWQAQADELSRPPLPPGILVSFPSTLYAGKKFDWAFTPSAYGLSGRITNHLASPICFRFDQARLQSSFQANAIPLRVYTAMQRSGGKMVKLGSNDPKIRQLHIHPMLCFETEKDVTLSFWPDLHELFPTQHMFNVSWPDGVPNLSDRGIGNWFKLNVPIEYEGKRETLEVTLTAVDSKARTSHY